MSDAEDAALIHAFTRQMSIYEQFDAIQSREEAKEYADKLVQEEGFEFDEEEKEYKEEEDYYVEDEEEDEEEIDPMEMLSRIHHKNKLNLPFGKKKTPRNNSSSPEEEEDLSEMLMAWYYAGYCTAKYKYQRRRHA
jgi:hypothetical protein